MSPINFVNPSKKTRNYHFNYLLPYHRVAKVLNNRTGDTFSKYNDTVKELQDQVIKRCLTENRRLRVKGSKWSLSQAPYGRDYIVDMSSLNLVLPLTDGDKHTGNTNSIDNYSFVQGGKIIKSISKHLANRGKSLKTSGASNGQTISGAIGTGVHGSAIDIGSVQDFVAGLHLITSDKKHVYVERASDPVLNDAFAAKINADVIRDDDTFNAALVGLGAFGIVIGVLMEVEDVFLLERHILKMNRNDAIELGRKQNFTTTTIPLPHPGERPYHYKFYMNPYKHLDDFIVEILYKRPFDPNYESPIKTIQGSYYGDLPKLVGTIVSLMKGTTRTFANVLSKTIFPKATDAVKVGMLSEIFYDTNSKGSVFGMAFGIEANRLEILLNSMTTIISDMNVPGLLSCRFVKGTAATLGFTRMPQTAIVEVDGVKWKDLDKFIESVLKQMKSLPFEFTLHWGKNADWSPELVETMYGNRKTDFLNERNKLITPQMRKIFTSKFLEDTGLT